MSAFQDIVAPAWVDDAPYPAGSLAQLSNTLYVAQAANLNQNPGTQGLASWRALPFRILNVTATITLTAEDVDAVIYVTTAGTNRTVTPPQASTCAGRMITVVKEDSAAGAVYVNPYSTEVIRVLEEEFQYITLPLQGDSAILLCDGTRWHKLNPYWHKVINPGTGFFGSKTTGWTADSFSGGWSVTWTAPTYVPFGTRAVRARVYAQDGTNNVVIYSRKNGDTNISNTPHASSEISHRVHLQPVSTTYMSSMAELWLDASYINQIAVIADTCDVYLSHPLEYLQ